MEHLRCHDFWFTLFWTCFPFLWLSAHRRVRQPFPTHTLGTHTQVKFSLTLGRAFAVATLMSSLTRDDAGSVPPVGEASVPVIGFHTPTLGHSEIRQSHIPRAHTASITSFQTEFEITRVETDLERSTTIFFRHLPFLVGAALPTAHVSRDDSMLFSHTAVHSLRNTSYRRRPADFPVVAPDFMLPRQLAKT